MQNLCALGVSAFIKKRMLPTKPRFPQRMLRVKTTPFLSLLGLLLLGACSSIDRGVVVGKGHRFRPGAVPPIECYWVDVRGPNAAGERVTERLQLFQRDWERFDEGDRIAPHDYDVVGAAKKISASVKKLTQAGHKPKHKPAGSGARKKSAPKTAAPRVRSAADVEAQYRSVEARAHGDATVRELKLKIHNAKTDEEQTAAFQEHRRALFQKMRELEPSLKERIDAAEQR